MDAEDQSTERPADASPKTRRWVAELEKALEHPGAPTRQQGLEVALQLLRRGVREMDSLGDFEHVLLNVLRALAPLGIAFEWASVLLVNLEEEKMHGVGYRRSTGANYQVLPTPLRPAVRQAVCSGTAVYRLDLHQEDPFDELEAVRDLGVRSVLDMPFATGTLGLSHTVPRAFTAADIDVLHRLAEVLSDAHQRLADLQGLEEHNLALTREVEERQRVEGELRQAYELLERRVAERTAALQETNEALQSEIDEREKQARRGAILHSLREVIWNMQEEGDIEQVLVSVRDGLRELGVSFEECCVNLVDAQVQRARVHSHSMRASSYWASSQEDDPGARLVVQFWQEGRICYRENLLAEDRFAERERIEAMFEHPVLCVVDAPFSHGTLAVNSAVPDAFSLESIEVLQMMAQILSEGFARMDDLRLLALSEERYRKLFEGVTDAILIFDLETLQFEDANQAALDLWGYSREEFLRLKVGDISHEKDKTDQTVRRFVENPTVPLRIPMRWFEKKDGSIFPGEVSTGFFLFRGRHKAIGAVRDITERMEFQQKLVSLERLQALGAMAAGVSHNLNNILVGVLGPAQLLERFNSDPAVLQTAREIIAAARRASDLVRRLNQAARGETGGVPYPVFVDRAVEQAVQTTRPRWKDEAESRGIHIEVQVDLGEVPAVRGTQTDLHDILVNLIFNAVDALPGGGSIVFSARAVAGGVQLVVRDTGTGMDEATRRRVFEPFFTTKQNVGSGLGLYTVYSMVARWDGSVEVESAPGQGTIFKLFLPAWAGSFPKGEAPPPAELEGRRSRVWIVDDDEGSCWVLRRLLSSAHEVRVLTSGREALEQFGPDLCDVALIDLAMPGVPGDLVAREMRRVDAAMAAVLITGFDIAPEDRRLEAFDFHLQKPFADLRELEHVLARAVQLRDDRVAQRR